MRKRNFLLPVTLAAATVLGAMATSVAPGLANFEDESKELIEEVWHVIDREYVDTTFNNQDWAEVRRRYLSREYKSKDAAYQGIRDMLKTLGDPYTRFMDPKQYASMQVDTSGEFQGVGIQLGIDEKTKELTVISPIEDTPAWKAGVHSRDVLLSIDGRSTQNMDIDQAVSYIRGPGGSTVDLKFRRGEEILNLSLVRTRIELKPVKYSLQVDQGQRIGYIRLTQFNANAARDMREAVARLNAQNVDGFVLDLRANPGGLLYASADIARMWLSGGTIVSTVDRTGQRQVLSASRPALTDKPLVVLVDGASASASEILSGALQDHHRAVLVGTKTFGKGLVQSVHSLSDGSGMAVTIARYQTPSGRDINKKGIEPDYKVELPKDPAKRLKLEQIGTREDLQFTRALDVLRREIAGAPTRSLTTASEGVPAKAGAASGEKAAVPNP